ncbi:methyltransferase type 11 [Annulohypoxylon maeteangense]|uniref:methyltransferase type 11 n=1 Tax=Annulohypoxylon maeteangense TaxID=1927788 RepID=UPI002008C118|nr:methyltransferase type 11 [Annulohypoxylon maeteangense]KAI0889362.1 methyltransferase type 11 [Annulohypoxylon maeteangense]
MPQNIYDQDDFFERYITLDRQVKGLIGAREWPQLRALLPDLNGLDILDLGCGFGWFSRFARENSAASVRAIDFSQNMLDRARVMTDDEKVTYERADLDELILPENQYDLVFSSLAFHYLVHLPNLIKEISKSLKPSGRLVFSIEHPIYTAPSNPAFLVDDERKKKIWPLDDYRKEGSRTTKWFVDGVQKQHRTIGSYINIVLSSGLQLTDFIEWLPTEEELKVYPASEDDGIRPKFLLVGAMKC